MEIERLKLMGYCALSEAGFALPCYASGDRPNLWYAAVCDISGDHRGKVAAFEEFRASDIRSLPSDAQCVVEVGEPWCDVFVWAGKAYVGRPEEIWAKISPDFDLVSAAAPLSVLELGLNVPKANRSLLARKAYDFLLEQAGREHADGWVKDIFLRRAFIQNLRRLAKDRGLGGSLDKAISQVDVFGERGRYGIVWPDELISALQKSDVSKLMKELDALNSHFVGTTWPRERMKMIAVPKMKGPPSSKPAMRRALGIETDMYGPEILVRTLSKSTRTDRYGQAWQYHSRSDHHSKVACWGIVFDLMRRTPLLRRHVEAGVVCFGINHEMRDFVHDRKKNLDIVLCAGSAGSPATSQTLESLAQDYGIELLQHEARELASLPVIRRGTVGAVLMALEAKACMTAHQRALPRLYDELNSSHLTVHGATDQAIAAGFAMVNIADRYLSPDLNKKNYGADPEWSQHRQPRDATLAVDKIRQLPRRSKLGDVGYDALAIVVIDCPNDGTEVQLVESSPAPQRGDIYAYASMIDRLSHIYATRFKDL